MGGRARLAWLSVLLMSALLAACGTVPVPGVDTPSGSPSGSPPLTSPSAAPSPAPDTFQSGDCTYPPSGGTVSQPAPDTFATTITVPSGWTLDDSSQDDSPFFMTAPASYQYFPTSMSISAPLPADPGQTASAFLARMTQGVWLGDQPLVVSAAPQACSVGGDAAAFLSFTSGDMVGFMVLWLHFGDAYLLQLKGTGGVDKRAVHDAKGVLASVTYAHNLPPPGYSPSATS